MRELEDRIIREGHFLPGGILKVDGFVNHQVDIQLMVSVGREIARLFRNETRINKIVTVEASGIAPALMTGLAMGLPVIYIKKDRPNTMEDCYKTSARSFTKSKNYELVVSKDYLGKNDVVLFVDDFLSSGSSALAALELCNMAGAEVVGAAFLVHGAGAVLQVADGVGKR